MPVWWRHLQTNKSLLVATYLTNTYLLPLALPSMALAFQKSWILTWCHPLNANQLKEKYHINNVFAKYCLVLYLFCTEIVPRGRTTRWPGRRQSPCRTQIGLPQSHLLLRLVRSGSSCDSCFCQQSDHPSCIERARKEACSCNFLPRV